MTMDRGCDNETMRLEKEARAMWNNHMDNK